MYWIFSLPIFVAVAGFAWQNPQMIHLNLWPFFDPLEVSLPLSILLVFAVGFFGGSFTTWIKGLSKRRRAREGSTQVKHLQTEIAVLKEKLAESRAQITLPPQLTGQSDL